MSVFFLQSPLRETVQIQVPVPTGGYDQGQAVAISNVLGFALTTADPIASNDETIESSRLVTFITEAAEVKAKKNTSLQINRGDEVFYDTADGNINKSPTGNTFCGYALESVSASAQFVKIRFQGGEND
jgi:hypothetical protein